MLTDLFFPFHESKSPQHGHYSKCKHSSKQNIDLATFRNRDRQIYLTKSESTPSDYDYKISALTH